MDAEKLVEAVARAIYKRQMDEDWDAVLLRRRALLSALGLDDNQRRALLDARAAVRATLEALREPTLGMLEAADEHWPTRRAQTIWWAMLDQLRKEVEG